MDRGAPRGAGSIGSDLVWLGIVYCLSHLGLFLIADAVFWDDWSIFGNAFPVLLDASWSAGKPWDAYFRTLILSLGLPSARIITFASHLIAGFCLYGILLKAPGPLREQRLLICLLFLTLPFFLSRTAFILTWYSLTNAAFFGGWFLLVSDRTQSRWISHVTAALLFIISFTTPSHLVFYLLPILHRLFLSQPTFRISSALSFTRSNIHLLALPVAFFLLKNSVFAPSGGYANYNEIRLEFLLDRALVPLIVVRNLFRLVATVELAPLVISTVSVIGLSWFWLRNTSFTNLQNQPTSVVSAIGMIILGGFAYLLGLFPYLVVNETPLFIDWSSRHQLLLPLGFSLAICGFLLLIPATFRLIPTIAIVSLSIALGWMSYGEYARDWTKQQSLIAAISKSSEIKRGRTFQVVDEATEYNAKERVFRAYEYNGFMRAAFNGEQIRLAADKLLWDEEGARYLTNPKVWAPRWNLADYSPTPVDCIIHIKKGPENLTKRSAAVYLVEQILWTKSGPNIPSNESVYVECLSAGD